MFTTSFSLYPLHHCDLLPHANCNLTTLTSSASYSSTQPSTAGWSTATTCAKISSLSSLVEKCVWESGPKIDPATGVKDLSFGTSFFLSLRVEFESRYLFSKTPNNHFSVQFNVVYFYWRDFLFLGMVGFFFPESRVFIENDSGYLKDTGGCVALFY